MPRPGMSYFCLCPGLTLKSTANLPARAPARERLRPRAVKSKLRSSCRWGTQATVKNITVESLHAVGSKVLLANTFHLLLRPGPEVFRKFGGIHKFMNWSGAVLTDSGGFQIFSLANLRRMDESGRGISELCRRRNTFAVARGQHRDAEGDRQRHHDGARSVCRVHRRSRHRAGRDAAYAPLGAPQSRSARRFPAGAFRHRAGRVLQRPAQAQRGISHRPSLRRVCDRRPSRSAKAWTTATISRS